MSKIQQLKRATLCLTLCLSAYCANAQSNKMPSAEEMWAMIQKQQQEIELLKSRLNLTETQVVETQEKVELTDSKIEATGDALEALGNGSGSGSSGDSWYDRTQIGGYGELHLNLGAEDQIDFHRWVLFISHDFNDRIRLFSELEVEHSLAGDGAPGEVELEQAFIEMDFTENLSGKAGVFLLPVGILNETHEPNTFYGVERNRIETEIIPSTWWEGGLALNRTTDNGFSADIALHSGLNTPTTGSNAFRIRSGRQKVAEAEASDWATTARVKYTGIPGVELAVSGQYQRDITQGSLNETIDATFVTAHADIQRGGFGFRALYGRWDLGGNAPQLIGADEQYGFYLEPSYRFDTDHGDFGFFGRYSMYDTRAGDNVDSEEALFTFGMNYWPHPNVVFKWDVQVTDRAGNSSNEEIVNLGVGYQF